ncbi:hypothetical protein ACIQ7D_35865 [Streptomyces sp. NPDC096310]|uniref:hypothetical protein n=1 Tax=Streptomyces sp. NPDC096310 TaxID=3366082 RepID=UPI003826E973
MPPDKAAPAPAPSVTPVTPVTPVAPVGLEQAEAALVEHYPRLVRIAYLVLPPSLGRNRRVLTAHALVQRSLPRGRPAPGGSGRPGKRRAADTSGPAARQAGYAYVRVRVLRQALEAGRPLRRLARPVRAQLPPLLPRVWGLRLFPRSGGADELALDRRLSALSGPARAAFVLRGLEDLTDQEVRELLGAAGADDVDTALAEAAAAASPGPALPRPEVPVPEFPRPRSATPETATDTNALLRSTEFDPCSLQARPTDLMRRRQYRGAALAVTTGALVCGALFGLPGGGWEPNGPAAPAYTRNPVAEAALDPGAVRRVDPAAWRTAPRTDFSVWPPRGALAHDTGLVRRALTVWARPGGAVHLSATPATPTGPPMGSPQLLYAGEVDKVRVVLFHDGLRVVRYAETDSGLAALDFARTDGADEAASGALVVARSDDNVRYLAAPWVTGTAVRDLLTPATPARPLHRDAYGVTDPVRTPAATPGACRSWDTLEVHTAGPAARLLTDLGELTPARLTSGPPESPQDVSTPADRAAWARTACLLPSARALGVRSVNSWEYARQPLPESNGTAAWLCTRADTWRGPGSRVLAQFQPPTRRPAAPAALAAGAADSPACGPRAPRVLAGVLWKSRAGHWYMLAAGSPDLRTLTATGQVSGTSRTSTLALPARQGAQAELHARTPDGTRMTSLR